MAVADNSQALYLPSGDAANSEGAKTPLNMVQLPLEACAEIDFTSLRALPVLTEGRVEVQLADVQFQAIRGPLDPALLIPADETSGETE